MRRHGKYGNLRHDTSLCFRVEPVAGFGIHSSSTDAMEFPTICSKTPLHHPRVGSCWLSEVGVKSVLTLGPSRGGHRGPTAHGTFGGLYRDSSNVPPEVKKKPKATGNRGSRTDRPVNSHCQPSRITANSQVHKMRH